MSGFASDDSVGPIPDEDAAIEDIALAAQDGAHAIRAGGTIIADAAPSAVANETVVEGDPLPTGSMRGKPNLHTGGTAAAISMASIA